MDGPSNEQIDALNVRVEDALRPLGLSLIPESCTLINQQGQWVMTLATLVRESAFTAQDQDLNDEFNAIIVNTMQEERDKKLQSIIDADVDDLFKEED